MNAPFDLLPALRRGLAELRLSLSDAACAQLAAYCALLQKWNRVYNLTAIREPEKMLTHHLLDSLAVLPHLDAAGIRTLADIGSGAGLPGIPLAIARPELHILSLDKVGKKISFQQQAKAELGLPNLTPLAVRAEAHRPPTPCDAAISRAFASLADFAAAARNLTAPGSPLFAMKGVYPADEAAHLPATLRIRAAHPLTVPGLNAERTLLILEDRHG